MTNLNQELIEKVRQGKAAIHNDQNKENKEKLRTLLSVIFPEDNPEMCYSNMEYYYASTDLKIWTCADDLPRGLEAIPLSAFFTNELPKEDKQLIGKIDEMLTQLNGFGKSLWELREHASLVLPDVAPVEKVECTITNDIAPVDTKEEVEYKVMLSECGLNTTKGRIYECYYQKGEDAYTIIDDLGNRNRGWDVGCFSHKNSTREAYLIQEKLKIPLLPNDSDLSQQGEQPKEWKVGEFVLDGIVIGYVTQVMNDRVLATNLAGNWAMNVEFSKAQKPTKEQVEQQLTKIAREKGYKKGVKILTIVDWHEPKEVVIDNIQNSGFELSSRGVLCFNGYSIWNAEKGWATIIKEEVKDRWKVTVEPFNHNPKDHRITLALIADNVLLKSEANLLADKIKSFLATL